MVVATDSLVCLKFKQSFSINYAIFRTQVYFFCLDLHVYLALHKANIPLSGLNNIVLATFQKEDIQFDYFK